MSNKKWKEENGFSYIEYSKECSHCKHCKRIVTKDDIREECKLMPDKEDNIVLCGDFCNNFKRLETL
jgi:hypothetical protein